MLPGRTKDAKDEVQVREGRQIAVDTGTDLALVKITGPALVPLRIRDSDSVREGQEVYFTGFPIGAVLGPFPATHVPARNGASRTGAVVAFTAIVNASTTDVCLAPAASTESSARR